MRRPTLLIAVFTLSLMVATAALWRGPAFVFAAQAQNSQSGKLQPVSATSGKTTSTRTSPVAKPATIPALQPTAAPGTEIYTAKRGETIPTIAHRYLGKTSYLTSSELAEAIRQANGKLNGDHANNILKANENIVIPGILAAPIVEKTIPVAKDFEVRAIYLTGVMAASDRGLRIIQHWREVGGNSVVFDIKDSDGSVNIPFEHPLLSKHNVYIHDVPKFVHFLHSQNMHAIARIAIFRDERMVKEHPELAVQSKRNGQPWRENGKLVWTDPSQPKVQEFDIALAKHVAQLGADEIQFDYVRFPAEGDQKDASFAFQTAHPDSLRSDVITDFLKHAYAELHPQGVLLSLDVFGVMAWQRPVDLSHTGQDIVGMAKYCDVLSPMIYPSHFFGMDGIAHPGDAPEHFIGESMARFELITGGNGGKPDAEKSKAQKARGTKTSEAKVKAGKSNEVTTSEAKLDAAKNDAIKPDATKLDATKPEEIKSSGAVIRPWLQAFHWRTKTYSPEYIKVQVQTAKDKGGIGFLFWNAANDYSKPYEAMPEMKAANAKEKDKFFRGDELPGAIVKASLTSASVPATPPTETASH